MPPKPQAIVKRLLQPPGDRSMTYISAFECLDGVVLCADTQETHEARTGYKDEKEYVEKLYGPENLSYPIAVGGAGLDEPIEAFSLELFERIEKQQPQNLAELRAVIKAALEEVHSSDAKVSAWPGMYRTTKCIVAAKPPEDEFGIFVTTGKRLSYRKQEPVIIGYETPANKAVLKRMYRAGLTMQQAVMLAIYLLSQSKARDVGVGGDPRIIVVTDAGAFIDDPDYVTNSERLIGEFTTLIDELFLRCIDASTPPSQFPSLLPIFGASVTELRARYLNESATISVRNMFRSSKFQVEPYQRSFPGAMLSVMADARVNVTERSEEEIAQFQEMREWAERQKEEWRIAQEKLNYLIAGRTPLHEGRERVLLRPARPKVVTRTTVV
jgi:hypothetical protein